MKFATKEELEAHTRATVRGAIEGVAAGFAIVIPAGIIATRRWPAFKALPIQLKALASIIIIVPCYAIQAERRGVEYDESTWTGAGVREIERVKTEEQKHWEQLTPMGKLKDWALHNQYKVIVGSWAVSMGIAGAIVMANKHQTYPQKIVQARMWAQGLTVGVLIGAGILTHGQRQEAFEHRQVDHSWLNVLEEQQREDALKAQQHKQPLAIPRHFPASA